MKHEQEERELTGYAFGFIFNLEQFLNCDASKAINMNELARRAGINRVQLQQYKNGSRNASVRTKNRIEAALRSIMNDLQAFTK